MFPAVRTPFQHGDMVGTSEPIVSIRAVGKEMEHQQNRESGAELNHRDNPEEGRSSPSEIGARL